jgi:hypothetical protein
MKRRNVMRKFLAILAVICCFSATTALAIPYSPTQSELLNYSLLWADNPSVVVSPGVPYDNGLGGAEFTLTLTPTTNHFGYAFFGKTYASGIDLSAYDSFSLNIKNDNENPWKFSLGIFNGINPTLTARADSGETLIAVDEAKNLKIDFSTAAVDLHNVNTIGFWVYEDVPIIGANNRRDFTPEFSVAPVPEPGTMMLLGAGFLGLAIYGKRRKNA